MLFNKKRPKGAAFEESLDAVKVCHLPWTQLGLGWNKFSVCCVSYSEDFGEIKSFPPDTNIRRHVFNHKNYRSMRESLSNPSKGLHESCVNCSTGAVSSNLKAFYKTNLSRLELIEDAPQKERARENLEAALFSIVNKTASVKHNPVVTNITCGSACNIKCRFCYNCNMNYFPDAADLLNIVNQVHETLVEATLTGGEPIITKAGRALLQEFANGKYKFCVRMSTNGQYADFDLYRSVNFGNVTISSDGATKKVYEYVREGGDFEVLLENLKKFIELKKEKPNMGLSLNFTVSSDNYVDIPEAVKLYEGMGLLTLFQPVLLEKENPQNFAERPELYEDIIKKVDEGISLTSSATTKSRLENIKKLILRKEEENARFN